MKNKTIANKESALCAALDQASEPIAKAYKIVGRFNVFMTGGQGAQLIYSRLIRRTTSG